MPITEKTPHVYEMTSKDIREKLGVVGVITDIKVSEYDYRDSKDGKTKSAFLITVKTMERTPDTQTEIETLNN